MTYCRGNQKYEINKAVKIIELAFKTSIKTTSTKFHRKTISYIEHSQLCQDGERGNYFWIWNKIFKSPLISTVYHF